jgi:hypothetical protein
MISDSILSLLTVALYIVLDFLVFKYLMHNNRKGLIQMLIARYKAGKKNSS